MFDVSKATRYIAVASASQEIINEWKKKEPNRVFLPVIEDYALMKVLYNLRKSSKATGIHVNVLQHTTPVSPLDFSGLRDSDVIFIAGHGNPKGLYAMGRDGDEAMTRLVDVLTADGNLKKRRQGKKIIIFLLSCRSGLGFHKALAFELFERLSIEVVVGGAAGFTFGSNQTKRTASNEVLVRGIPWHMEYLGSIPPKEAEAVTSAREKKAITIAGKQTEIDRFIVAKTALEDDMRAIVQQLDSKSEIDAALTDLELRFGFRHWEPLLRAQFELYSKAKEKEKSNLEFDMWFKNVTDGYLWTDGQTVTKAEADAILAGDQIPVGDGFTSTR
jgi:hypothetical protein